MEIKVLLVKNALGNHLDEEFFLEIFTPRFQKNLNLKLQNFLFNNPRLKISQKCILNLNILPNTKI